MNSIYRTLAALAIPPAFFLIVAGVTFSPSTIPVLEKSDQVTAQFETDPAILAIWEEECAPCHGKSGDGKTRAGKRAGVKDFTDPEYQKTWTDSDALQVVKTAKKDGKELKNKDPYGEKYSDDEIKKLIAHVRTLDDK